MTKANADIRQYAKEKRVHLWEIAKAIGCNDGNLSRKLRTEMSEQNKNKVMNAIDRIAESHIE